MMKERQGRPMVRAGRLMTSRWRVRSPSAPPLTPRHRLPRLVPSSLSSSRARLVDRTRKGRPDAHRRHDRSRVHLRERRRVYGGRCLPPGSGASPRYSRPGRHGPIGIRLSPPRRPDLLGPTETPPAV